MLIHNYDSEKLSNLFGIQIGSIEGLNGPAGWGRVGPGERSTAHRHDETEFFVIVKGHGRLLVGGAIHEVVPGNVVLFEPFETHIIINTGSEDLVFFLSYRRDAERAGKSAASSERQGSQGRPQFVFSTPPTPNGDLHLGHLSGPYLGADVYVRYQRLLGHEAWHLTGSDDYQSYVDALAKKEGKTPRHVADFYSQEIRQTLAAMDIECHQFTVTNSAPGYANGLQDFFTKLTQSGWVGLAKAPSLEDPDTGEYLYEVGVYGSCPGCGTTTNGNICEECGEPNIVVDMGDPIARSSEKPATRVDRELFVLPLDNFSKEIQRHHSLGRVPARLKELATRVLSHQHLNIPLTHQSDWGIRPRELGSEDQVIWVWPEMSYGFLYSIELLGKKLGRTWRAEDPQQDWKIVHFFGYDNSFYHGILYPVLYKLAWPAWEPDIDYHVNEFYLLDGKKFSTSRRHAVWGKDILTPSSVDSVRYYLCLTRPEEARTNFQLSTYEETLREELVGKWQAWLDSVGQKVHRLYDGVAPDAGIWSSEHSAFLAVLGGHRDGVTSALNPDGFSLQRAASQLTRLVKDAIAFAGTQQRLAGAEHIKDEYRTSVALELAAALLLARLAAPLMPRFSTRLLDALGIESLNVWPDLIDTVPAGSPCRLNEVIFFQSPIGKLTAAASSDWLAIQLISLLPGVDLSNRRCTLQDIGASSLVAVTLQYQLMRDKSLDIPIDRLMHTPIADLSQEIGQFTATAPVVEGIEI